jgi:LemA protein
MIGVFLLLVFILFLILIGFVVVSYNRLVTLRNRIDNAWAQIDVQLRRRFDLIPNLVETVKGYAKHERETFEKVTEARAKMASATTVKESADANNMISSALKSLFAVAEAYPELKANQNFLALQEELAGTEGKVAYSRQFYNDNVMQFNTLQQTFPTNLIASTFGFKSRDYFEIEEPAAKEPVKVQFT